MLISTLTERAKMLLNISIYRTYLRFCLTEFDKKNSR